MGTPATAEPQNEVTPERLRLVVAASAAGTAFEWYDFFIFATLASVIGVHFTAGLDETGSFLFALFAFAVGFAVRPLGAVVFGRAGDKTGRKRTFLITISMMGVSTFLIGLLPDYAMIGPLAPVLLIALRCVQGFALGGEYGGAAIFVAEHAPAHRRGFATSWIQTSAGLGLLAALGVILATRTLMGEDLFRDWGWRIPFLLSAVLFGLSMWMRLKLEESPVFRAMKEEGRTSKAPLAEAFGNAANLRLILLALFGVMLAQGVVWYTAVFYAQFFLERLMRVDPAAVNVVIMAITTVSVVLYVAAGYLSDLIGRKPVMLAGCVIAVAAFFPVYGWMAEAANPALKQAMRDAPVTVTADPAACAVMFDPLGRAVYRSPCDIARSALANAGVGYTLVTKAGAAPAISFAGRTITPPDADGLSVDAVRTLRKTFDAELRRELTAAGYPAAADSARIDWLQVFGALLVLIIAACALYGPQAAALVELFPARVRYTALSVPYHIGTGWFGGFLPAISFAIITATGNIYAGLWYPVIGAAISLVVALIFLPETRGRSIS